MELTKFERDLFCIEKDCLFNDNAKVMSLFHSLLLKVEREPYRPWTHYLLRNYVDANYALCATLNERAAGAMKSDKQINVYDDADTNLYVFFTGLYTPNAFRGLKCGLYFVRFPDKTIKVMSKEEIMEYEDSDLKSALKMIDHRDSFENELDNNPGLIMELENIIIPNIMPSTSALKKMVDDSEKKQSDHWLHILIDGIDNVPTEFIMSFFDKFYEVPNENTRKKNRKEWLKKCIEKEYGSFENYQEIMIETMRAGINTRNNLPIIFCKKKGWYNYLLPMYMQNGVRPDYCIVLRKKGGTDNWEPVTSLDMDEAYCDIRIFGRDAIQRVHDWWQ